jgi:DNA-binding NarL/FixJ family response regulator
LATSKIRVLLADDHPVFREGMSRILSNEDTFELVAVANDGKQAVRLTQELHPDVVVMDIDMPIMTGIEAAGHIRTNSPNTAVLILSAYNYDEYVIASIRARVDGYLLKTADPLELVNAVHMIHSGKSVFDTKTAKDVFYKAVSIKGKQPDLRCGLHPRELEVLELVCRGKTNKEIGTALAISEHTVGAHLANIFRKIGVESRTSAALYAMEHRWFTKSEPRDQQ